MTIRLTTTRTTLLPRLLFVGSAVPGILEPPESCDPALVFMYGNRNSGYDVVLYNIGLNEYWGLVAAGALTGSVPGEDELWSPWISGGRFYILGGREQGSGLPSSDSRTVASFPLPTSWREPGYAATWTNHGIINTMVSNGAAGMWSAVAGGYAILGQGMDRSGPSLNESEFVYRVAESSLPTNTWIPNTPSVTEERNGTLNHAAVANDGLIYFGGGTTIGSVAGVDFHSRDPVTNANDDTLADMPEAKYWAGFASDGDFIYVAGGYPSGGGSPTLSVDRYNIATDVWEAMPDTPTATNLTPMYYHDGFLYRITLLRDTIYRYPVADGLSGVWTTLATPSNPDGLPAGWTVIVPGAATENVGNYWCLPSTPTVRTPIAAFLQTGNSVKAFAFDGIVYALPDYPIAGLDVKNGWIDENLRLYGAGGQNQSPIVVGDVRSLDLTNDLATWQTETAWPGGTQGTAWSANSVFKYPGDSRVAMAINAGGLRRVGAQNLVYNAVGGMRADWNGSPGTGASGYNTLPQSLGWLGNAGVHCQGWWYVSGGTNIGSTGTTTFVRYPVNSGHGGAFENSPSNRDDTLTAMPRSRSNHTALTDGQYVYILGGQHNAAVVLEVDRYDPATDSWVTFSNNISGGTGNYVPFLIYNNRILHFLNATVYEYDLSQGTTGVWVDRSGTYNPSALSVGAATLAKGIEAELGNDNTYFDPAAVSLDTVNYSTAGTVVDSSSLVINAMAGRTAGDLLLCVMSATGTPAADFSTPGWTAVKGAVASHKSRLAYRVATGDANDNLTITMTSGSDHAIAAVMLRVEGAAWHRFFQFPRFNTAWDVDATGPNYGYNSGGAAPGAFYGGYGPSLSLCFWSMQNNSGTQGTPSVWNAPTGPGATMLATAYGARTTFNGVTCAVAYSLSMHSTDPNVTSPRDFYASPDTVGGGEYGTAARVCGLVHIASDGAPATEGFTSGFNVQAFS